MTDELDNLLRRARFTARRRNVRFEELGDLLESLNFWAYRMDIKETGEDDALTQVTSFVTLMLDFFPEDAHTVRQSFQEAVQARAARLSGDAPQPSDYDDEDAREHIRMLFGTGGC